MANCREYQSLDFNEKTKNIGILIHLFQNDTESFVALSSMIRGAEQAGKLIDVKILPDHPQQY